MLTLISALVSSDKSNGSFIILSLAAFKFIGVSFYFMEIKKAHSFWKYSIVLFITIAMSAILIILK
jgi:hypothetical protein